jgi:hypothetical protein
VRRDHRVVAFRDQHHVAIAYRQRFVDLLVCRVDLLDRVAFGAVEPVVVELFEVHLAGRIMDVVLVGRVA